MKNFLILNNPFQITNTMKIIDVISPDRVNRSPDKIIQLISSGKHVEQGYIIKNVQLKLYIEKIDEKLGPYSLITVTIETDQGAIEIAYADNTRNGNRVRDIANNF